MTFFLILIWILLQRGILSQHPENQHLFFAKHFGILPNKRIQLKDHAFEESKFSNDLNPRKNFIHKRNAVETLESAAKNVKENLLEGKVVTDLAGKVFYYPITVKMPVCPTNRAKNKPKYDQIHCEQVPGRVICHLGKITFVVNNGEHTMEKDIIQKFIVMAYDRYGEGDDFFDIAVDEMETTLCACFTPVPTLCEKEQAVTEEIPVVVECDLISNEKLKMCNPNYDPSEKIYQCRAKTMGLKKKSILHLAINDNKGVVSYAKDPLSIYGRERRKRELMIPDKTNLIENKKLRPRSRQFNDYFDQEEVTEENDLSNLFYHSKLPYVRNYTDKCTISYYFNYWCPRYSLTNPCELTKLSSLNNTERPCREAKTTAMNPKYDSPETTTLCTIEITTEDIFVNPKKTFTDRRKRHRIYWRGRRRLQKALKSGSQILNVDRCANNSRVANAIRDDLQSYADSNVEGKNSLNSGTPFGEQVSTCNPTPEGGKVGWPTQSCTTSTTNKYTFITQPGGVSCKTCGSPTTQLTSTRMRSMDGSYPQIRNFFNSEHQLQEQCHPNNQKPRSENNSGLKDATSASEGQKLQNGEYYSGQLVQQPLKFTHLDQQAQVKNSHFDEQSRVKTAHLEQRSQVKIRQMSPLNTYEPKNAYFKDKVKRYLLEKYPNQRSLRSLDGFSRNSFRSYKLRRPRSKLFSRIIPRIRRKQVKRWMTRQIGTSLTDRHDIKRTVKNS